MRAGDRRRRHMNDGVTSTPTGAPAVQSSENVLPRPQSSSTLSSGVWRDREFRSHPARTYAEQLGLTETEEKVYLCLHRRVGLRLTVGTGLDLVRSVQSPT
jgi:hypothetical protein